MQHPNNSKMSTFYNINNLRGQKSNLYFTPKKAYYVFTYNIFGKIFVHIFDIDDSIKVDLQGVLGYFVKVYLCSLTKQYININDDLSHT